jgi:hypothetical protein
MSPENRSTILSFVEIGLVFWAPLPVDGKTDGHVTPSVVGFRSFLETHRKGGTFFFRNH